MTSSRENSLNIRKMQVPNGTGQGVQEVSVLFWLEAPIANVLWKSLATGYEVKVGNKVKFGNNVKIEWDVWSMDGVTVYGHVPDGM